MILFIVFRYNIYFYLVLKRIPIIDKLINLKIKKLKLFLAIIF